MKDELRQYLQIARESMLWKLDGLPESEKRRPLTPTGTNLLGLVKHLAIVEYSYFGPTFDRSFTPQFDQLLGRSDAEPNSDMWATADESPESIVALYRQAWAYSDETIQSLDLESVGRVPHWPSDRQDVTLHRILIQMIAETNRHAGHADIVRELIDRSVGMRLGNENMPDGDAEWWVSYRARLESVARESAE